MKDSVEIKMTVGFWSSAVVELLGRSTTTDAEKDKYREQIRALANFCARHGAVELVPDDEPDSPVGGAA